MIPLRLAFLCALLLMGCEEDVGPREQLDAPFSLYGVLSPELDTQSVRVYPIEPTPTLGLNAPLDAVITSTDLSTGEKRTWRDSARVQRNGQVEHVFWSVFRAEKGHDYRVEAVRTADGAASFAEVRIPAGVSVSIAGETEAKITVSIDGGDVRPLKPEIEYAVKAGRNSGADPDSVPLLKFAISYQGTEKATEADWRVTVDMLRDAGRLYLLYHNETEIDLGNRCPWLALHQMNLIVIVGNAEWDPPGGVFNAEILADPALMSNVENGFGFVGGGYRVSAPLHPSAKAVEIACFENAL